MSGIGLVTALGADAPKTWRALLAGEAISDHARVPGLSSGNRIHQIALAAAREAIADAGWSTAQIADPMTAMVVGTSKGPVERWASAPPGMLVEKPYLLAGRSPAFGLAELASEIGCELGWGSGYRTTLSAACASGIHALAHAAMLLRSGSASQALVIAAEASVDPLFVGSFKRLGVLADEASGCRPFDENRTGFLISEAAAAICLTTHESAGSYARVENMAIGGDGYHLTSPDPSGRSLGRMIQNVVTARPVDLFHAHATGTSLHDPIELTAIESAVQGSSPIVYSHKGSLGHSLGASGLVAVAINCLAHREGKIPGNVRTQRPLQTRLCISPRVEERLIRRSVAVAAGFGGAMGAISLIS